MADEPKETRDARRALLVATAKDAETISGAALLTMTSDLEPADELTRLEWAIEALRKAVDRLEMLKDPWRE